MSRRTLTAASVGLALAALSACSSSTAGASSGDELTFAAIPAEQNADPLVDYGNIIKLIEKNTGKKVRFVRSTDYNAVIEGTVSGKIDIAEFGPLSYVLAKNNGAKVTPIASTVSQGRPPTYQSYAVVKADSPITGLAGLKGKKVCFVDPGSTSGYLFPAAALMSAGIDPKTGVSPVMAGGHDNSVTSVTAGTCDAGFAYDQMVDKLLVDKGKIKQGDVKVIWKSRPIPNSPIAIRDGLPEDVRRKLTDTFVKDANKDRMVALGVCADVATCKATSDGTVWGFGAVDDATFDPIREVCATTKHDKCSEA
ncbi:phosphate/phosphite/phosphonate ABC transporter substrate-binding protein [Spongiactinospora sp. TRM90649]|uniref:phosphate/phosphite/phosphonate ABC transporter substrate-binding protein n=1 Tax=Spongiactinospora sp. TRM90649 TaxID=3031114 RepID=UPI0023F9FBD5|nr:phosphate/phosphite/phosphonate ABC transporter substrate-binding protein [Spongiactinospora sp. TRM90649]MDF5757078.1 phosphate/phosphite/phosphonate ABC transporter substrate-binding protein [Spongiactinospora sp. TRM90649]